MTQGSGGDGTTKSTKWGGTQIDHADEDPEIHREFEAELAKAGITCVMGDVHPFCTQRSNG